MVSIRNSCGHRGFLYSHSCAKGVGWDGGCLAAIGGRIGKRISLPFLPLIVKKQNECIETLTKTGTWGRKSLSIDRYRTIIGLWLERRLRVSKSQGLAAASSQDMRHVFFTGATICSWKSLWEVSTNLFRDSNYHTGTGCDWAFAFPQGIFLKVWNKLQVDKLKSF